MDLVHWDIESVTHSEEIRQSDEREFRLNGAQIMVDEVNSRLGHAAKGRTSSY